MALFQNMKNPQWAFMFGKKDYLISKQAILSPFFTSRYSLCCGICSVYSFFQISIKHGFYVKYCARYSHILLTFKHCI